MSHKEEDFLLFMDKKDEEIPAETPVQTEIQNSAPEKIPAADKVKKLFSENPFKKEKIIKLKKFINRHAVVVAVISAAVIVGLLCGILTLSISNSRLNSRYTGALAAAESNTADKLNSVNGAINDKDAEISEKQAQIDEKNAQIDSLNSDNAAKDATIQDYEGKISSMQSALTEKRIRQEAEQAAQNPPPDAESAAVQPESFVNLASGVSGKTCYLTFDDGPSANTPQIVNILNSYGINATFFVTGSGSDEYIKQANDAGNTIALHTYTHDWSIYSSSGAYYDDLQKISDRVERITGKKSMLLRFPGGASNTKSEGYCAGIMTELTNSVTEKGYTYFDWNCDSGDAEKNQASVDFIMSRIKQAGTSKNSIVVLMHDAAPKTTTVEALPQIIKYFGQNGYTFAPITPSTPPVHHHVNN